MVERTVDTDADSTADQRRIFSHTAGQIALHFENQSASNLSGSDLERRYLWNSQAVDSLLADEAIDGTQTADDILWPLADNLNTTRDVVRYDTSTDTASVTNHLTYDAFGNVTSETSTASADDTLFHHTGKILDEHTGNQWHNYRWYSPETASWLSADPIGFAAGDTNLYRYVGNNVLVYVDPHGLQPPLVIGQPGQPSGQPIGPSIGIDSPISGVPITLPPIIRDPGGAIGDIGRRIGEVPIIRGGPPVQAIIRNPGDVVDDYWKDFLDRLDGRIDDVIDGAEQDWIDRFPKGDYSMSGGLQFGMFTHKYRMGASCCGTDGFGACGEANFNTETSISCVVIMDARFEASSGPFEAFGAISSRFAGGFKHSIDAQVGVDASVNGANASCDFSSDMSTVTEGRAEFLGGVQAGDVEYDRVAFYAMMAARAAANESGVNWNSQVTVGTVFEVGNARAYLYCAGGVSGDQDGITVDPPKFGGSIAY